ncbi:hypothetical protein KC19_5G166100 [Ceratodon purpureus]|uniref:COBRA C-terminal domain-containing protein n=1 Tax=Ceratodon purpureus TaxID=3225 RepID=A0A8T0I2A5_CERPU|nr:hypothetical protein KC19_5G166100 [Ceratodon purpureus]
MGGFSRSCRGAVVLFAVLVISTVFVAVSGQGAVVPAPVAPPPLALVTPPVQAPVALAPVALPPVAPLAPILAPAPAPAYIFPSCDGVEVVYTLIATAEIFPNASTPAKQPYSFEGSVTLTNKGYSTLDMWGVGMTFQHNEIMVSADGLSLEDGRAFPVNVSDGAVLSPSPPQALRNSIETAGDATKISKVFNIIGTEFGEPLRPMPVTLNITSKGYNCTKPKFYGNTTMHTCCVEPSQNITLTSDDIFLPPIPGDITITYDVLQAYTSNYRAMVTISNDSPVGRLDNWNLQWTWQESEFIYTMQGARPKVADTQVCVGGLAGKYYTGGMDVNNAMSCSVSPVISDLPLEKTNDTTIGNIKYCCRNGTIMPAVIDPSKSKSAFTMNVYKLPPNVDDALHLVPPAGFKIGNGGDATSLYTCGAPRLIAPSLFPDPYLDYSTNSMKTWQVSCNVTEGPRKPPPKCCVSFSSYHNDSIVPCPTCACGCKANPQPTCSANTSAMLLPYSALTLAPENRTAQLLAWASILHKPVPNPLPCPDNCGVSINWHIVSDYSNGWSARMSLFGWDNVTHPEWFAVVEMPKALPGFEKAYTFNATKIPPTNTSFVVQGLTGYNNYLLGSNLVKTGVSVLQSVISFTKKLTPGIQVKGRDGFPTKVWFNGEECAMPDSFPTSGALRMASPTVLGVFVLLVCTLFLDPFELL